MTGPALGVTLIVSAAILGSAVTWLTLRVVYAYLDRRHPR